MFINYKQHQGTFKYSAITIRLLPKSINLVFLLLQMCWKLYSTTGFTWCYCQFDLQSSANSDL